MIKIYDNVVLFGKIEKEYNKNTRSWDEIGYSYYVSDSENKQTLKTGKQWAIGYSKDNNGYVEIPTENKGFRLSIDSAAEGSSQGGKLSFWMCKIDKDDIHGRIGINQKALSELFKESTFINGVCQQEVCFYRENGNVGACVVGGERYKQFYQEKADDIRKEKVSKTVKWEQGRCYESKTLEEVWLCDVVNYFNDKKYHLILNSEKCNNIEELIDDILFSRYTFKDKFPSRIKTDKTYDLSNLKELFVERHKELIIKEMKYIYKMIKNDWYSNYHIDYLDYLNYSIDKDSFPKEEYIDMLYIYAYYFEKRILENNTRYGTQYSIIKNMLSKFKLTVWKFDEREDRFNDLVKKYNLDGES